MSEHHNNDVLRRLERIDRDRLLTSWSDSEAKQALFQEITTMPVDTCPSEPAARRRTPKRRAGTVLAVAALTVLTGTMAIASGGFTTENTPGVPVREMSEFAEVVEPYRDVFVFAPHRTFEEAVGAIEASSFEDDSRMAEDGMADMVGSAAVCSWLDHWRTATLDGDDRAAAQAVERIDAARDWPWALVNTEFFAEQLSRHETAMRAGDVTYVTWELGLNCLPAMTGVPTIPPTGPVPEGVEQPTQMYLDDDMGQ